MYHLFRSIRRARQQDESLNEKGQGLFEYAIILGLVGLVVIGIVALMRPAIADVFDRFINSNAVAPPAIAGYTPPPPADSTPTPLPATVNLSVDVSEGAGGFTVSPVGPDYGTDPLVTVSILANPDPGSEFVGWDGSVFSADNPLSLLMDGDKVIHARFREICFTLTTDALGAGEINALPAPNCPSGGANRYRANTVVSLQATVTSGNSSFNGWLGNVPIQGMTNNPLAVTMDGDKSIQAAFTVLCYTLSMFSPDGGGSISTDPPPSCAGQPQYSYGNTVTLIPTPLEGYEFDHWGGDASGTANPGSIVMDEDKDVEVYYRSGCYALTTAVTGDGHIDIDSAPPVCPTDATKYVVGTVNLTAVADGTDSFLYWSGDASGLNASISVPLDTDKSVIANFDNIACYTLSAASNPIASGAVNVQTTANCIGGYLENTSITVNAQPEIGQMFTSWSGGGLDGVTTNPATYNILSDQSITANFTPAEYLLSVNIDGAGSGTVTAVPAINCPGTCSDTYTYGTEVTLIPTAGANSIFTGWGGAIDCDDGQVTVNSSLDCTATFQPNTFDLNITVNGNGSVSSVPAGISCPGTCSSSFTGNTNITLTPTPNSGHVFTGWTGNASCGSSINLNSDMNCIANFAASQPQLLTIQFAGNGSGVVNLTQPNADCSANCIETYNQSENITLTAIADYNSVFAGWSGDAECGSSVTMPNRDTNCVATFNRTNTVTAFDRAVSGSNNDAEEMVSNGDMDRSSSDLEMVMESGEQIVGVRFRNVAVPSGSIITNAYIIFTSDETDDVDTSLIIHGQAGGNPPKFASSDWNISNRPTTTASASWRNIPEWSSVGTPHKTANLKDIVQEIINRGDWSDGNSMAFIVSGSGKRVADSTDGTNARLHIEYATGLCTTYNSTDVPKAISSGAPPNRTNSELNVASGGTILDVNVWNLSGTHTWISDLDINLTSPQGTAVQIANFNNCGSQDDFDLNLDDEGSDTWGCPPTGGGTYLPANALSAFDGQNSTGTWTLSVDDNANLDGGSLDSWSLEICVQ